MEDFKFQDFLQEKTPLNLKEDLTMHKDEEVEETLITSTEVFIQEADLNLELKSRTIQESGQLMKSSVDALLNNWIEMTLNFLNDMTEEIAEDENLAEKAEILKNKIHQLQTA